MIAGIGGAFASTLDCICVMDQFCLIIKIVYKCVFVWQYEYMSDSLFFACLSVCLFV